jgi:two-component system LytT family response regulator
VYLLSGKKLTISKTMKVFEKSLEGLSFLRVHHSYIINLTHIEKYVKGDGGTLVMKDNRSVPVSRACKAELLARIGLEELK